MQKLDPRKTNFASILVVIFGTVSAVAQSGDNNSVACPGQLYSIYLHGIEYPKYTHSNGSHILGELPMYVDQATHKCCAAMKNKISYKLINVSSSDGIEKAIRSSAVGGNPTLFFPVFANKDDEKQFGRDFIGFYESPGLAVFQIGKDSNESDDYDKQLDAFLRTWPIVGICILAALLAGMILWILVSYS